MYEVLDKNISFWNICMACHIDDYRLLECDVVLSGRNLQAFRTNVYLVYLVWKTATEGAEILVT